MKRKNHQILMLPTKEANAEEQLCLIPNDGLYWVSHITDPISNEKGIYQHLYILSDDEIIAGDYYVSKTKRGNIIFKCDGGEGLDSYYVDNYITGTPIDNTCRMSKENDKCFKIVASTDKSITPYSLVAMLFVIKYVNAYYDGKTIIDVYLEMVPEMSEGWVPSYNNPDNSGCDTPSEPTGNMLIKTDNDGYVIIHLEDRMYTTEEAKQLIQLFYRFLIQDRTIPVIKGAALRDEFIRDNF